MSDFVKKNKSKVIHDELPELIDSNDEKSKCLSLLDIYIIWKTGTYKIQKKIINILNIDYILPYHTEDNIYLVYIDEKATEYILYDLNGFFRGYYFSDIKCWEINPIKCDNYNFFETIKSQNMPIPIRYCQIVSISNIHVMYGPGNYLIESLSNSKYLGKKVKYIISIDHLDTQYDLYNTTRVHCGIEVFYKLNEFILLDRCKEYDPNSSIVDEKRNNFVSQIPYDIWMQNSKKEKEVKEKEPEEKDLKSEDKICECSVCMDNSSNMVFVPCGHICICEGCSKNLQTKKCVICNMEYTSIIKIYYA